MTNTPAEIRNMLQTYGKQLTNAKRLARFRRALKMSEPVDVVSISRQARRRELVEKISREIIENLIVSGNENPVVSDILEQLELDFGEKHLFEYPLDGSDVQVLKENDQGVVLLSPDEMSEVMNRLWEITLDKVDRTML
ncbi:DVU0524 family FlgM-associated protein [Desulfovibrio sp. UCD-KL4C]|uniref:DVU0524 family FlgM-associated protein n=1 Tax=Desulfovibrio sp. UCD-KL4C TaxID=2578120 RepID=UPI0025BE241D|nr:DVU0524 family FlgM-associated protein [Desulfovibrio sp. UCD-KL4C]